ncbi:hypothetical protein [Arsenophonus nasoniae]|uniref:Conserved hypothetical phage protein n=1 Tax=Arsenophonus nasoniae TaxID=638 RepID=D2U2H0_9GAMM|nr:hypothetical protein [Arsenophonus nasoniae]QBY41974.1 hypothetical protein ArsFIN_05070 [Arsenophonus nasoniae]WGM06170.1 hypothetical protein QE258_02005 [Arsenophonus nasoniae]CBA75234.1 conserved hypothetical phage protein [Arsenophonus nasoniae]
MKPISRCYLSHDEVHLVDAKIMLELSACGRGFLTVETNTDYTGKLVRFDTGYTNSLYRYFMGYVERTQPTDNGFQKLFVRELVGLFDKMWPCSFQHPTLKTIIDYLQENSGLTFILPEAKYSHTPIPHFTHNGTGFQLLTHLGAVFSIDDYVWYQMPDGKVFVGSWADSMFKNDNHEVPAPFSKKQSAGNSATFPLIPALRAGTVVNGKRVNKIQLENEDITLYWTTINPLTGKAEDKSPIHNQIDKAYPELSAGLHLPQFARIESPSESVSAGDISDPFRPKYAVDVQLLDSDGNGSAAPTYKAVPLPLPMAGSESGLFQFPPEGTIVEIAFEGGRPDKPFIRQTLSQHNTLPDIQPGEQLQQQRQEVFQRVTVDGSWHRETDQSINECSMLRTINADKEQRTLVSRETTVQATDTLTVFGMRKLLAGAIQHLSEGDYAIATSKNYVASIEKDMTVNVGQNSTIEIGQKLIEKVGQIKQSIAGAQQHIIAPVVWIGSQQINVAQLMLETLAVVKELAELTAAHTHNNTGAPLNASSIKSAGSKSDNLKEKYSPVISQ